VSRLQKQLRSNSADTDDDFDDIVELAPGYRRRDLTQLQPDSDELSERVKLRLLIARLRALEKFRNLT
jgi:hypothetical protein